MWEPNYKIKYIVKNWRRDTQEKAWIETDRVWRQKDKMACFVTIQR